MGKLGAIGTEYAICSKLAEKEEVIFCCCTEWGRKSENGLEPLTLG